MTNELNQWMTKKEISIYKNNTLEFNNILNIQETYKQKWNDLFLNPTPYTKFVYTHRSPDKVQDDFEYMIPRFIKRYPNLKNIKFFYSKNTFAFNTKNLKDSLENHSNLKCLKIIVDENRNDDKLNLLLKCFENSSITTLKLNGVILDDLKMKMIEKIKNLEKIEFIHCKFIYNFNEKYNFKATYLKITNLRKMEYFQNFPNLAKLHVSFNPSMKLDFLELKDILSKYKLEKFSMFIFNIEKNEYLQDIFQNISKSIHIETYNSKNTPLFNYLKDHSSLKKFKSFESFFDFKDFELFLSKRTLECLKIGVKSNVWGENDKEKLLIKGLSMNRSLKKLKIENMNSLKSYFKEILLEISKNESLDILDLSNCGINDLSCKIIAEYLSKNDTLKSLNLSRNYIGDEGMILIFESLFYNRTLKSLSLGDQDINFGNEICETIFDLLKTNQSLKNLSLNLDYIQDDGLNLISKGLLANTSLISLNLGDINEKSILSKEISSSQFKIDLFDNHSLQYLKIFKEFDEKIFWILKRNSSYIKTLSVKHYIDIQCKFE